MIDDMGYELVQIRMISGGRRTLQIMVEPKDHQRGLTLDDCSKLSYALSAVLDVADPIAGAYSLEISSPGIDRPLVRLADYERFAGMEAKLDLVRPVLESRKLKGKLAGIDGGNVLIESGGETLTLAFANIRKAKLVLSDELIKKAARERAAEVQAGPDREEA